MKIILNMIVSLIILNSFIYAKNYTQTGKITAIQVSNHNTIYFKMNPMPKNVSEGLTFSGY
jgi:hypothetical protein